MAIKNLQGSRLYTINIDSNLITINQNVYLIACK